MSITPNSSNTSSLVVRIAKSQLDITNVYRLRYESYLDAGYIQANSDLLDVDNYDKYAIHLIAEVNGRTAGTMRVFIDSNSKWPIESVLNISEYKHKYRLAEVSRYVVRPNMRYSIIALALFRYLYWLLLDAGITHLIVAGVVNQQALYAKFGFKPLSDPLFYPSLRCYFSPMLLQLSSVIDHLKSVGHSTTLNFLLDKSAIIPHLPEHEYQGLIRTPDFGFNK